jgi:hypothetical protein
MKVVTTNGTMLHDCVPGTKGGESKEGVPLTEEAAEKLAAKANAGAKALRIKTRYEVVA